MFDLGGGKELYKWRLNSGNSHVAVVHPPIHGKAP